MHAALLLRLFSPLGYALVHSAAVRLLPRNVTRDPIAHLYIYSMHIYSTHALSKKVGRACTIIEMKAAARFTEIVVIYIYIYVYLASMHVHLDEGLWCLGEHVPCEDVRTVRMHHAVHYQ